MQNAETLMTTILQVAMVSLRIGTLWIFFPFFSRQAIPMSVRVAGMLTLSLALLPIAAAKLPVWTLSAPPTAWEGLAYIVTELFIGLGMGFLARLFFFAILSSAEWTSMQIGFSASSMFNPDFDGADTSWAVFCDWVAIMLFLGIGGHWMLLEALASSYKFEFQDLFLRITDPRLGFSFWAELGTSFFVWVIKLSGPMVVVVFILQIALGVLSKFVPQINVWSVSMPITLLLGVFFFTLLSPMYGDALSKIFEHAASSGQIWMKYLGAR